MSNLHNSLLEITSNIALDDLKIILQEIKDSLDPIDFK